MLSNKDTLFINAIKNNSVQTLMKISNQPSELGGTHYVIEYVLFKKKIEIQNNFFC